LSSLTLNDMISNIQNKQWTKINNFFIEIHFQPGANGSQGSKYFAENIVKWNISNVDLNAALKSITTTEYTNAQINKYVSYEWRYHMGRDQLYRFNMIFRDYDQMHIYNTIRMYYFKAREQYFDNIKMTIKVFNAETFNSSAVPIFQTESAIIESVSHLDFSHDTENQIAEFSVNFMCNTMVVGGQTQQFYETGKALGKVF